MNLVQNIYTTASRRYTFSSSICNIIYTSRLDTCTTTSIHMTSSIHHTMISTRHIRIHMIQMTIIHEIHIRGKKSHICISHEQQREYAGASAQGIILYINRKKKILQGAVWQPDNWYMGESRDITEYYYYYFIAGAVAKILQSVPSLCIFLL